MEENKNQNTTKYGEFVCSFYQWLPLDIQKKHAKDMSEMTKREDTDK